LGTYFGAELAYLYYDTSMEALPILELPVFH
jgi:hypothetical protein